MKASVIVVLLTALVYLIYGVLFAIWPEAALHWVTGAALSTESGVIDLSATYGGLSLGIAWMLWTLSRRVETLRLGLQSVLALMLGMASVRIWGIIQATTVNRMMWIYLATEIVLAVVAVILLKSNSRSDQA